MAILAQAAQQGTLLSSSWVAAAARSIKNELSRGVVFKNIFQSFARSVNFVLYTKIQQTPRFPGAVHRAVQIGLRILQGFSMFSGTHVNLDCPLKTGAVHFWVRFHYVFVKKTNLDCPAAWLRLLIITEDHAAGSPDPGPGSGSAWGLIAPSSSGICDKIKGTPGFNHAFS